MSTAVFRRALDLQLVVAAGVGIDHHLLALDRTAWPKTAPLFASVHNLVVVVGLTPRIVAWSAPNGEAPPWYRCTVSKVHPSEPSEPWHQPQ